MITNGERALAYVAAIDEIKPIDGYDRVEYARTNGWWVVVSKNDDLHVGDKCVYFEIDSKVPETDERFKFLESRKYRIKTQKMCKVLSQGLLMPLSVFPELGDADVGTDVTKTLGITYYVPEDNERKKAVNKDTKYQSMAARHKNLFKKKPFRWLMKRDWGRKMLFMFFGKKKDSPRGFPPFVRKTDEERCLAGNTKILTNVGPMRIADIVNKRLNVDVASYNEATSEIEYKPIDGWQKIELNEQLIDVGFPYRVGVSKLNHVTCTKDHKFLTPEGYKNAGDLTVNDWVYMRSVCYENSILPIVCGMLLGDSSIDYDKRSNGKLRIDTTHGEAQLKYLEYINSIFGSDKVYKMKSGYCDRPVYRICSPVDARVDDFLKHYCWINGRKTITKEFCDAITPVSLAIWYMDDGNIKHKFDDNASPSIILSSNSFSKEENELLIDCLNNRFGIKCNLRKEKEYWGIYITTEGTQKFLRLITEYIHPDLRYKTLTELENVPFTTIDPIKRTESIVAIPIKEIVTYNRKRHDAHIYDITVRDNHNFFANGVLTHNCENQPWRIGDGKEYQSSEKLDGTSITLALERKKRGKYEFYVCSRNVRQKDESQQCYHDHNIYWDMAFKYNVESYLRQYLEEHKDCNWVCIQGEGVGSVQGNPLKLDHDDLYIFNFIDSANGRYPSDVGKQIVERWGMKWVPLLGIVKMPDSMEELKKMADGKSVINPSVDREGIVYRSLDGKDSFKNVSNKYLLKMKDE